MSRRKIDPRVDTLRTLPLFEGCNRRELQRVAQVADEAQVRAGVRLTRQGEVPYECYVLVSGTAEVRVDGAPVANLSAPTLIGAESLRANTRLPDLSSRPAMPPSTPSTYARSTS